MRPNDVDDDGVRDGAKGSTVASGVRDDDASDGAKGSMVANGVRGDGANDDAMDANGGARGDVHGVRDALDKTH